MTQDSFRIKAVIDRLLKQITEIRKAISKN